MIAIASSAALAAPDFPIASVPTGTPRGIWTIDNSASAPPSVVDGTGTPSTGRIVLAATTPGRCAAPPAPAISTSIPRCSAVCDHSSTASGVRCAESTRTSCSTPKSRRMSTAPCSVSRSVLLPMMMPTSGFAIQRG